MILGEHRNGFGVIFRVLGAFRGVNVVRLNLEAVDCSVVELVVMVLGREEVSPAVRVRSCDGIVGGAFILGVVIEKHHCVSAICVRVQSAASAAHIQLYSKAVRESDGAMSPAG